MKEQEREVLGDLECPDCGQRRILYPVGQNVSSLTDPKCKFIHIRGGRKECE